MTDQLAELARLRCRAVRVRLGPGPSVEQLALRLSGEQRVVALSGRWAGGRGVVASQPLLVLDPADLADGGFAALATQPLVTQPSADAGAADVVGGGWFGCLGYDGPSSLAFYDHVLRLVDGTWWFEALHSDQRDAVLAARREDLATVLTGEDVTANWSAGPFRGQPRAAHLAAVERAVEEIRAGQIYQVNVCTRLGGSFSGSAAALFAQAAGSLRPDYAALVDDGARTMVSLSPELFLRRRGRDVLTSPIKGTRPRADDPQTAAEQAADLRRSTKDAAENVMIVDLMRNDLGRVCATGTVRATALLGVEPHPGVWHLVSSVQGTLRDDASDADLLRACFPPGSVTGAPKLRAMDVITRLESSPRGSYTGALGFVSPLWGLELNVAIRTFEIEAGRIELGVGGGVTADSVPILEWQECLHKAAPLLGAAGTSFGEEPGSRRSSSVPSPDQVAGGLLETILVLDGVAVRLSAHLARLDRSCRELYAAGVPSDLAGRAGEAARSAGPGRGVLRIVATPSATEKVTVELTVRAAGNMPTAGPAQIIRGRVGCWRHKWAGRAYLTAREHEVGAAGVALFIAEDGTVLETTRGNLFGLTADGTLVTPPLRDDVLPGITRLALLDHAHDVGQRVEIREFDRAELVSMAAFWTSSLSGLVPITAVDGAVLPRSDDAIARLASAALSHPPAVDQSRVGSEWPRQRERVAIEPFVR